VPGYDMTPWKVQICGWVWMECETSGKVRIDSIPRAPEPGRVPKEADHVHIVQKLSGEERDAREDHKWRGLLLGTARCSHGRLYTDNCRGCLGGTAADVTGEHIGHTSTGKRIIVPPRNVVLDIRKWVEEKRR